MKAIPHPRPWRSSLWPHLDRIRKLRLARKSWLEVAAELQTLGVQVSPQAIGRFFDRARKAKLPVGFEPGRVYEVQPEKPKNGIWKIIGRG